jgi:putative protease
VTSHRTAPELLAPAGTPRKLKTAFHFGADAVYVGLKRFSMRSFAGNFDLDQLAWAVTYARERGKRLYVAINVQPYDDEIAEVERTVGALARIGPDALIVGDAGVLGIVRREAPQLAVHLSTQAGVTNAAAAEFWRTQGVERIILARELRIEQLAALVSGTRAELETFAHGAVCIGFSGRCFLSLYWAGRDPRRGECAQGCRWPYKLIEDRRHPGEAQAIVEDERGTHFFDAKDLCALPVLDRLLDTGVRALKIEGRTRSEHYVGVVVDVYRQAMDCLAQGDRDGFDAGMAGWMAELSRTGKRPFSTHFLTGDQDRVESYSPGGSPLGGTHDFLGRVMANRGEHVLVSLQNPLRPGASVELCDRGMVRESVTVELVRDADGTVMELAREGDEVRIDGRFRSRPGALVRLKASE